MTKKEHLNKILKPHQVSQDPKYGQDWLKLYTSKPDKVLLPETHKNVCDIVQWANNFEVPLVPCGGLTGLSGGAVAKNQEVMVSFERMNQVQEFNPVEQSLCVQAGVLTKSVQDFAKEKGLLFPLSFASEGSSQIGGNVSTNAGGVHVIRYGLLSKWILGLKVVTGEGHTLSLGRGLIKNTAGYQLMPLFIGAEGTLGLITQVTLQLTKTEGPLFVFLLAVPNLSNLLDLYSLFKKTLTLNSFEMFTGNSLPTTQKIVSHPFPLKTKAPFFALVECEQKDRDHALSLFETALEKGYVTDGVISESQAQASRLWAFRENISEGLAIHSPYKNDISVRPSRLAQFLEDLTQVLKQEYPEFTVVTFGHIGDGNLHINILKPKSWQKSLFLEKCENVNKLLFSITKKYEGSISAEHGVGLLKKAYLSYSCSKEEIQYMKAIKKVFDPKGILNPGKVF